MAFQVWDLRKVQLEGMLPGHSDTITGLSLSPDGSYLLSNSMDCTGSVLHASFLPCQRFEYHFAPVLARIWDVRPFAPVERCLKMLQGHQHNFEKVPLLLLPWNLKSD